MHAKYTAFGSENLFNSSKQVIYAGPTYNVKEGEKQFVTFAISKDSLKRDQYGKLGATIEDHDRPLKVLFCVEFPVEVI